MVVAEQVLERRAGAAPVEGVARVRQREEEDAPGAQDAQEVLERLDRVALALPGIRWLAWYSTLMLSR